MEGLVFNPLVPELTVSDLERSLGFYVDLLGFRVMFEEQSPNIWQTAPLEQPYGRGINLEMGVRDVHGILERLQAVSYPLFRPLMRNEYRAGVDVNVNLEFLVQDPDGYLLRFALEDA